MEERTCGNCSSTIRSIYVKVCPYCGEELLGSLASKTNRQDKQEAVPSKGRGIFFYLTLLLIIALLGGVIYLFSFGASTFISDVSKKESTVFISENVFEEVVGTSTGDSSSNINLYLEPFALFAPEDVDLFVVSSNLVEYLTMEDLELFSTVTDLSLETVTTLFDEKFCVMQRGSDYAFIAKAKDKKVLQEKIDEIKEFDTEDNLDISLIEDYLVFTTSSDFTGELEAVYKKNQVSLDLTSKYNQIRNKLPKDGLLLLYAPNRGKTGVESTRVEKKIKFLPETARGFGYVLRIDEGKIVLHRLTE